MTMKVTVLGAGGFIGSNLVEFMLGKGDYDITGIDVTSEKLAGIGGDAFEFKQSDIMADEAVEACINADLIVDLVAYANPSLYIEQPLDVFHLNFTTNMHVVDLAVKHRKRLVQYSTCEVYGKPTGNGSTHRPSSCLSGSSTPTAPTISSTTRSSARSTSSVLDSTIWLRLAAPADLACSRTSCRHC